MLNQFINYIKDQELFNANDKVLLAVSGGMDSVVMCELFKKAGFNFGIAHCNFKLRNDESDGDQDFVKVLADKLSVDFHSIDFNTENIAEE